MNAPLHITLLGKLEISLGGVPLGERRRKSLALLAYLAVTGKAHSREALAGLLWGEATKVNANAALRKVLAELRELLDPYLIDKDRQISFNRSLPYQMDVEQFEQGLAGISERQAASLSPEKADTLATAIDCYQGDFLAGFYVQRAPAFEEWVTLQRERMRLAAINGLYMLSIYTYSQGDFERSIHYTRRLLEMEPCQEEAHRQMMSLLALSSQRELALRQYQICRQALADTFGVAPQDETTALYQRIRAGADADIPPEERGRNLPTPSTPLIGRQVDVETIENRLADPNCRLITILGPGGGGKTHMALEVGARLMQGERPLFDDGIYFVPLNPLRTIDALPSTIARHLGYLFHKNSPPFQQLLHHLASKKLLLILDNFEHLLAASRSAETEGETDYLTQLFQAAPGVKLMVTSRVRLNLRGEHLYPLSGIEFPANETELVLRAKSFPAVELFIQSVRRVSPDFEPGDFELAAIAKICQQVRGLPLGILLAASWASTLSPVEMATRLASDAGGAETGLDFLETAWADFPARHRSLRRVLAHSWNLLAPQERDVLANLSIFRGSFSLQAAQQVGGARLRDLRSLVEHSLVQRTASGRYEIHELLRQFARSELEEISQIRDRHCAYYAGKLEGWAADIKCEQQMAAIEALDLEIDNARAAWDWAVAQGNLALIDQAMDGLCSYYEWRYRLPEGSSACQALIERLKNPEPLAQISQVNRILAQALAWQSIFDHSDHCERLLRQSLAYLDDPSTRQEDTQSERAFILYHLAAIVSQTGDHAKAREMYAQSSALYEALGDRWGLSNGLKGQGILFWDSSDYAQAQELLEKSLEIYQEIGDQRGIAASQSWLGITILFQGQIEGERLVRESSAIYAALGDHISLVESSDQASMALMMLGRYEQARDLMEEKRMIDNRLDFRQDAVRSLLASALIHLGEYQEARVHAQAGLDLARRLGDPFGLGFALAVRGWLALADGQYEAAHSLFRESAEHCKTHGLQELFSWALAFQGLAEQRLGKLELAKTHMVSALQTALEIKSFVGTAFTLVSSIPLTIDLGTKERALEHYALVSQHPMVANSAWFDDIVGRQIEAIAAQLPPDVVALARERGQGQELDAVVAEVLADLEEKN
ncbi:MAG: tetratricopeptide repeat protein [Chloroflexi bacterium]|nr:tetratricopeptide repeat protein [Chloroflexota bacterium]